MNPDNANDSIVKEIAIHAPAERVFDALTDPQQRVKWWGVPGRFQVTHMESDLRPGGRWLMRGSGAESQPFTLYGQYRVVERPRLLEFTWCTGLPEPDTVVRFELDETDGVTTVRLTHSGFTTGDLRQRYQGWPRLLASLQALVEEEVFRAAR